MPFTKGYKINLGKRTGKNISCKYCSKEVYKMNSELKNGAKFCSRGCITKYVKPHLNHPHSEETKKRMSDIKLKTSKRDEESIFWKGENVGYRALHNWVEKHLGKASFCSNDKDHITTRYHWANISHEYKRDLKDWMSLCPKCHFAYDRERLVVSY